MSNAIDFMILILWFTLAFEISHDDKYSLKLFQGKKELDKRDKTLEAVLKILVMFVSGEWLEWSPTDSHIQTVVWFLIWICVKVICYTFVNTKRKDVLIEIVNRVEMLEKWNADPKYRKLILSHLLWRI